MSDIAYAGELVRLEVEDGIGTIRLDRPPMNALNGADPGGDPRPPRRPPSARDVAAVVVYGGEKVFAAGADIKEMEAMSYTDMVDHSALLQNSSRRSPASPSRRSPRSPATRSAAAASSRSPATSASRRTTRSSGSRRSSSASSPAPVVPSASRGSSGRRRPRTSSSRAGSSTPRRRCAIGLVDKVVPAADVYAAARAWMLSFVGGPAYALRAAKEAIDRGLEVDLDTGLEIERMLFAVALRDEGPRDRDDLLRRAGPREGELRGSLIRRRRPRDVSGRRPTTTTQTCPRSIGRIAGSTTTTQTCPSRCAAGRG